MKKLLFTLLVWILPLCFTFAQQVTDIKFTKDEKDDSFQISYTLDKSATISILLSTDGGKTYTKPLRAVTGDVGINVTAGKKNVVWIPNKEPMAMPKGNIMFKVNAFVFDIQMVYVAGGKFKMGCTSEQDDDCWEDEHPTHYVKLNNFYIGKYEITQKQWKQIMDTNPSRFNDCEDCPVDNVSWMDIQEFLRRLNAKTCKTYRLPTEAEWEYAARGGAKTGKHHYCGSNDIEQAGWYWRNSGENKLTGKWSWNHIEANKNCTHPVGQKHPNELGIYDMSGNVWEWCNDWKSTYSKHTATNPTGAENGSNKIMRGGAWDSNDRDCRTSSRYYVTPGDKNDSYGFRLVLIK